MITFTRAQLAVKGSVPTSAQWNSLARGGNERILSGIGNWAYRVVWYMLGLVRNPRMPKIVLGDPPVMEWPPVDEWLGVYGLVDPRNPNHAGLEWPVVGGTRVGVGMEEGINRAWPLAQLVYGNGLDGDDKLGDEFERMFITPAHVTTLESAWEIGKAQRGTRDVATGAENTPALEAAQAHSMIGYHWWSPFLKDYGGFLPTRQRIGWCGDQTTDTPNTPMYEIVLTNLKDGRRVFYSGFCPNGATVDGMTAIWGLIVGRYVIRVYRWDGVVDLYSTSEWMEGPYYGGGVLNRKTHEQLEQGMNRFVTEFRGSQAERAAEGYRVGLTGFDNQSFYTRQYLLAPARGEDNGDGTVSAIYPKWRWTGQVSWASGVVHEGGALVHAGFVCAGFYVKGWKLVHGVTIEVLADGEHVENLVLSAGEAGTGEFLIWLERPVAAGKTIGMRLASALDLTATDGEVWVEMAELVEYKPWLNDGMLVLRLGSTTGGDSGGASVGLDSTGLDFTMPVTISDKYFRYGCIVNDLALAPPTTEDSYIGDNPVYEAARQLVMSQIRYGKRERLQGYEVDEDGNSVLYWDRFELLQNLQLDIWRDIGPSVDAVTNGTLMEGRQYEVRGGMGVQYNGNLVSAGSKFVATSNAAWEVAEGATGEERVYEVEGIWTRAPMRGKTNRWVVYFTFGAMKEADDNSFWKLSNYNDNFLSLNERCHLGSDDIKKSAKLRQHLAYNQKPVRSSEAPDGYRYVMGSHQPDIDTGDPDSIAAGINYYRSCQIYEKPYELKSVTRVVEGGKERVKMVLKGRLRHLDEAPQVIGRDPAGWSWLENEGQRKYRTDENGICDYLYYTNGYARGGRMVGDVAPRNDIFGPPLADTDQPDFFALPRAWFVKLMPEVYEDDNEVAERSVDTRMKVDDLIQVELHLRSAASGWIDSLTSENRGCDGEESYSFDFTFGNLIYQASEPAAEGEVNKPYVTLLPAALRGDLPIGYSPLPRFKLYAECYNLYANAMNLLTKARIELPLVIEYKQKTEIEYRPVTLDAGSVDVPVGGCDPDTATGFGTSTGWGRVTIGGVASGGVVTEGDEWSVGNDFFLSNSIQMAPFVCGGGGWTWGVQLTKSSVRYRVQPGQYQWYAVPEHVRELLDGGQIGLLGRWNQQLDWYEQGGDAVGCNGNVADGSSGPNIQVTPRQELSTQCRILPTGGEISAPSVREGVVWIWKCTPGDPGSVVNGVGQSGVEFRAVQDGYGGTLYVGVSLVD